MIAVADLPQTVQTQARLTLQSAETAADTTAIRCLDWDRFDIENSS